MLAFTLQHTMFIIFLLKDRGSHLFSI